MKFTLIQRRLALLILIIGVIYVLFIGAFYNKSRNELIETGHKIFMEMIDLDMDRRLNDIDIPIITRMTPEDTTDFVTIQKKGHPTIYKEKTDSFQQLSNKEKLNLAYQSMLLHANPIHVNTLDSLFLGKLQGNDIKAQTAVIYTDNTNEETTYSNPDHSSYQGYYAYPSKALGMMEEITLQAFIKISPVSIVRHAALPIGSATIVWVLLVAALSIALLRKEKQIGVFSIEYTDTIKYKITDQISLDVDKKVIIYKSGKVKLSPQNVKLLQLLLRSLDYFMTDDNLIKELYGDIEKGGKNRLSQAVKRTRKELQAIPELEIENVSKSGYKLIVHSDSSAPTE